VFLQPEQLTKTEVAGFLATLGHRIKQIRKEKKLLMRDLLTRTGYYDQQWRKYEAGGSLTIPSLLKIAVALQVTISELLDGLGQWPEVSVTDVQQKHGIEPTSDGLNLQPELESEPNKPKPGRAKNAKVTAGRKTVKQAVKQSKAPSRTPRKDQTSQ